MVDVELDHSEEWGEDQDWQKLAERAVAEAFKVSSHGDLAAAPFTLSLSISLSTNGEVQTLNAQWREKDKPTNVLSFPMLEAVELASLKKPRHPELVSGSISPHKPKGETAELMLKQVQHDDIERELLLGDLILAHGICAAEAAEKAIPLPDHITHLIVHGTLHLLGLDHIDDAQAEHMEALEVKALASLGLGNPYSDH